MCSISPQAVRAAGPQNARFPGGWPGSGAPWGGYGGPGYGGLGYGGPGYGGGFGSASSPYGNHNGEAILAQMLGYGGPGAYGSLGSNFMPAGPGLGQNDPYAPAGGYGGAPFGQASPFLNLGASEAWAGTVPKRSRDGRTYLR